MNENVQSSDDLLLSFNQNSFCLSTSRVRMKELLRCAANIAINIEIVRFSETSACSYLVRGGTGGIRGGTRSGIFRYGVLSLK